VTTVLIAASNGLRLAALLGERKTLHVLMAAPGLSLAEQIDAARPDVLLVDHGPERLASRLRLLDALPRSVAIVVLGDDARGALGADALRAGVRGVLPRDATADEIGAAIEAAAAGLVVLHPHTVEAFRPQASAGEHAGAALASQPLTPREVEVLGMMAEGAGNKLIASRLAISEHTVKFHIASIFAKLNAGSRTEAVTIGLRRGLIMI
jgi:two-component system, NarL family, response regulator YdfI